MKIKYIFFACLFCFSTLNIWADTGKCSYLESDVGTSYIKNTEKGSFGYYYNIELCKEFEPILKEAEKYVQSIKKPVEGKTIREVTTDIGNTLCRGDFGTCGENAFSDRFKKACSIAREKAMKNVENDAKKQSWSKAATEKVAAIKANDEMYAFSINECPAWGEFLLKRFKKVALVEASRYHGKIIESSNKKYLKKSYELMQNLSNTIGTVVKKMSSVAQHFQWFTKQAYNTGVQIMS